MHGNLTYIDMAVNAFDYTALSALYMYREHHFLQANAFFIIHDTCTFHHYFLQVFNSIPKLFPNITDPYAQIAPRGFNSNIMLVGHRFPDLYGHTYTVNLTKREAIDIEQLREGIEHDSKRIPWLRTFGNVSDVPERVFLPFQADTYNSGHSRHIVYYEVFGIFKHIFWCIPKQNSSESCTEQP